MSEATLVELAVKPDGSLVAGGAFGCSDAMFIWRETLLTIVDVRFCCVYVYFLICELIIFSVAVCGGKYHRTTRCCYLVQIWQKVKKGGRWQDNRGRLIL
jgi:hypothetical protein